MINLALHQFHEQLQARFTEVNGLEAVDHYGDVQAEYAALNAKAGLIDLSLRSRLCLTGADRLRLLNGQVTNNVKDLEGGQGCYAALVTAKGKLQSDLNVYCLAEELLLDLEPGLNQIIAERLDHYIIADDVQVTDVGPHYGLLSVQGPDSAKVVNELALGTELPSEPLRFAQVNDSAFGEIYCMNQPRLQTAGFDLFVPTASLGEVAAKLLAAVKAAGGSPCGWQALEMLRIEAGIPRYGVDMDETNLAPETGIESRAISYSKGCYIGQEVIARIRTYGQVARQLRGLRLGSELDELPRRGDKLFHDQREVGYITSALRSPAFGRNIALGYVRREHNQIGTVLNLGAQDGSQSVRIVPLPFNKEDLAVEQ